jgi:hypothetical protein
MAKKPQRITSTLTTVSKPSLNFRHQMTGNPYHFSRRPWRFRHAIVTQEIALETALAGWNSRHPWVTSTFAAQDLPVGAYAVDDG